MGVNAMLRLTRPTSFWTLAAWGVCICLATGTISVASPPADQPKDDRAAVQDLSPVPAAASEDPSYTTRSLRGRVVWMADALSRHFGIQTVSEAAERVLALETPDAELHPIVEDIRGRSFRVDQRLREIDVELLVRQYAGSPMVQVIRLYALKKDGKYELDYWCDICAIAMFELKPCDCCQGPVELRERLVENDRADTPK